MDGKEITVGCVVSPFRVTQLTSGEKDCEGKYRETKGGGGEGKTGYDRGRGSGRGGGKGRESSGDRR